MRHEGYGMIYGSIFDSSVSSDWRACVVFIASIALADAQDNVYSDPERFARKTNFPLDLVRAGLELLLQEDPYSLNTAEGGRRIILLPLVGTEDQPSLDKCRGWKVVNRSYYKRLLRKKYNAAYAHRRREAERNPTQESLANKDAQAADLETWRNGR